MKTHTYSSMEREMPVMPLCSAVSATCENVTCPGGKHCAQDQHGVPHCVRCRSRCGRSSSSPPSRHVCGGDGHTYSSFCALERHTCLSGRTIRLAYRGNCRRTYLRCLHYRYTLTWYLYWCFTSLNVAHMINDNVIDCYYIM